MGRLEESGKRKTKRKNIKSFILNTVGVAGMLGVALVAPNVLGAMGKLGMLPGRRQKEVINRARDRLIRQGLLIRNKRYLQLTPKGQRAVGILQAREFNAGRFRRWDGKWRILIFDIPEYRRPLRSKIRRTLLAIGFVRLQDSVWIYPYDCEDLVALLKADFRVGKDMLYLIVEELEGERRIKQQFGLH